MIFVRFLNNLIRFRYKKNPDLFRFWENVIGQKQVCKHAQLKHDSMFSHSLWSLEGSVVDLHKSGMKYVCANTHVRIILIYHFLYTWIFAVLQYNFLHSCYFPVFYILLFTLYFLHYIIFRKVMLASKAPHNKCLFKDSHANYNKTSLTNKWKKSNKSIYTL